MLSYDVPIIIIRDDRVLYTGTFSPTSSRKVNWWLEEYGGMVNNLSRDALKLMCLCGLAYNRIKRTFEPLTDDEKEEIKKLKDYTMRLGYMNMYKWAK